MESMEKYNQAVVEERGNQTCFVKSSFKQILMEAMTAYDSFHSTTPEGNLGKNQIDWPN